MLKGKWEFEDYKNANDWTPEKSFRICAEIGTEYDSDTFLESIRWYRTGDPADTWKVQSLKSYSSQASVTMGNFCTKTISDQAFENEGLSEIEIVGDENIFDVNSRKLSFEFTRPFDVQADQAMTLIGGFDFKIWTTWTIAANPDAIAEGRNRIYQYGNTLRDDFQKIQIQAIADPTIVAESAIFLQLTALLSLSCIYLL